MMINIPKNIEEPEIDLYLSGYKFCMNIIKEQHCKIADAVSITAERYSVLITDIELFKRFLCDEITAYTEPSIGVVSEDLDDTNWWSELKKEDNFTSKYWHRYYDYLKHKSSWSLSAVIDLDTSTDNIMNALANPRKGTAGDRMGMVFGYVQSGKTAHYIGLINKAYDAGYNIVIVLTGVHNNLRSQTQSRIDEEILGYETSLENLGDLNRERNAIGVGRGPNNQVDNIVQSITTRDDKGDVNKKTETVSMMPPFILVTKKNASVLRSILNFFKKNHCAEVVNEKKKILPAKFPALIIDDEADLASINTNKSYDDNGNMLDEDNYNPTTINKLIRNLLDVFECKSYVGYTATPFANIFIPPSIDSDEYGKDLFPRDFIFRTPIPDQYIGGKEFFGLDGDENTPMMPLYRPIIKGADYLGKGTKIVDPVGDLPEELKTAIKYFLISTALRNCRGQVNMPNTMLIHIIRFIKQQNIVRDKVKDYIDNEIANYVQYGDSVIEKELKAIWELDYIPTSEKMNQQFNKYMNNCENISWDSIWNEINRLIRNKEIIVYSVNGESTDVLIYKNHIGKPFNVIVIGGDKLSRGLTLEGLTVSYFTRSSSTYDTLMQMGRWFGFRPGYLDACRLFTTDDLYSKFSHISMATEDLASQFNFMNNMVQTPKEFGLRVATHPLLEITSRNKMRTGKEVKLDFSGKLTQTRVFDIDGSVYDRNFEAVENLLNAINNCRVTKDQYKRILNRDSPGNHYFWMDVPAYNIVNFFENYESSKTATRAKSINIAGYIKALNFNGVGGVKNWTVCLINVECKNSPSFEIAGLKVGGGIYRSDGAIILNSKTCSIRTMTSKDHEYYDYSAEELKMVKELKKSPPKSNNNSKTINEYIRIKTRPFEKGLLLLYPIGDAGTLTQNKGSHKTPFGFAVVFPDRKGKGDLKSYRMNDVAWENDKYEYYD